MPPVEVDAKPAAAVPGAGVDAPWGYFDHDADFGVIGRGATVEAALVNAARATFALMWDPASVARKETIDVEFEEADVELALPTWLNALLGESSARHLALADFSLVREGSRWRGKAWGEPWRDVVPAGTGVKGATLTALAVRRDDGGVEARCVVDV
jgi:SHS2 domain-containing protein